MKGQMLRGVRRVELRRSWRQGPCWRRRRREGSQALDNADLSNMAEHSGCGWHHAGFVIIN